MVVAQLEARGDPFGERTKALAHRLLDRLERLEAIGAMALAWMPTHSAEQ